MKPLLLLAAIFFTSCVSHRYIKRACICTNVYESVNFTVHQFETINQKLFIDAESDTIKCNKGDTVLVSIRGRNITIETFKN